MDSNPDGELNQFILDIHRGTLKHSIEEYKAWVLDQFAQHVHFDSAMIATGVVSNVVSIHSMYLHKQPEEMLASYARMQDKDFFLEQLLCSPGKTLGMYDVISREDYIKSKINLKHARFYGMEDVLSTAILNPHTILLQFLSINRSEPEMPFTRQDKTITQIVTPHIVEACSINYFANLNALSSSPDQFNAICDHEGVLYETQFGFAETLHLESPRWQGPELPSEFIEAIGKNHNKLEMEQIYVEIKALNELFLVSIRKKSVPHTLTQREQEIAQYQINGNTYKEIAHKLGISPSTVTNHVNHIYRKLSVSNKSALMALNTNQ